LGPLLYLAIGVAAAWIAGRFMRGHGFGLVVDIIVGVIGAFASAYGYQLAGSEVNGGLLGHAFVALLGALLLLFIVRVIARRRGGRRVWS
jgi:uncharacterized membrane protein YeaQ/YmgE (transglycosylase-associated protein family)